MTEFIYFRMETLSSRQIDQVQNSTMPLDSFQLSIDPEGSSVWKANMGKYQYLKSLFSTSL